ncbi:MAG: tetratricopeptide repeat protein [Planctomycetes bacterium]|nr:tetratricopeptide repeat protein [Planctomycetota bacterium]
MDVDKFLAKAEQALRKRAAPQAIALYRQVLVASPGHGAARTGLLSAFRRQAELKGGPGMLDKAAARTCRAAAAGLVSASQWGALAKTCETGLERDPFDGVLAARLADALAALGRPEEALAVWTFRLEIDERDALALREAGKLHYTLRNVGEAIRCLDRAHAVDPHDPEVEKLRKNLAAEGTLAATHFDTASSSRELVKDKDALRKAERSGRLHKTSGELAEDIADLEAALAGAPGDLDLRRTLIRARLKARDAAGALADAEAGLASQPEDDGLLDLAGEARLLAAEDELARATESGDAGAVQRARQARARLEVDEFSRRSSRSPNDVPLRLRLAKACYRAGETEQAVEHFQAIATDPRVEVEARQGLGACFFRKGLMPLARRQFEQALTVAGGVTGDRGKEICYHLGLVCERLGDNPGALARYMEIYEVDIHYKDVGQKIEALNA